MTQQAIQGASPTVDSPPKSPSVYQLLRERIELSDDPDPAAVVAVLLEELDVALLREAARQGLMTHARRICSRLREEASPTQPSGSAKWELASRVLKERPDVLGLRVVIGFDSDGKAIYRFLGDCSGRQLEQAEELVRSRIAGLKTYADRLAALRAHLKGQQCVRDLPLERVQRIFDA